MAADITLAGRRAATPATPCSVMSTKKSGRTRGPASALAWAQSALRSNGGGLVIAGVDRQLCSEPHGAVIELRALPGWRDDWSAR
ncbi:hypothetical protein BKA01_002997 [Pseudonocardia eucalypti]|nr:hypothetical protein [Pseudonocardia eucalypti]